MHVLTKSSPTPHPHSPLPRRLRELALYSRANPLPCAPEWEHWKTGAMEARLDSWTARLAPLGMGNNPVQLPRELGLAGQPLTVLILKDRATNTGLNPYQLLERFIQNLQQSLARVKHVQWAQFIPTVTMQSSSTIKRPKLRKAWEDFTTQQPVA